MSNEEAQGAEGAGTGPGALEKPESSSVPDGRASAGVEKDGGVEGQDEEGSPDQDAEEGYEGDPGGGPEEEGSDGEQVVGLMSSVVETDDAVVRVVEPGGSGEVRESSGASADEGSVEGEERRGGESGSEALRSGGVDDREVDGGTVEAGARSGGAEADEEAETRSDERESAVAGGAVEEGRDAVVVKLAVLEGQLGELFDASMEHTALLEQIVKRGEKEQPGKDDIGKVLNAELKGLGEQIGVVRNLVSEVSQGLEKSGEKGEEEKVVKELQSWITDTLKAALSRLEESISGLAESGDKQIKAFEGVKSDVDVVKKVGEAVGALEDKLRAYKKDLSRENELGGGLVRWVLLSVVAVAAPGLLLAGAFVGQRWEVLPVEDATAGWRDHVWERYGGDLVGCVRRSLRDQSSFECVLDVRGSVDEVRARASGR